MKNQLRSYAVTQLRSYAVTLLGLTLLSLGCADNAPDEIEPHVVVKSENIPIISGTGHGAFFIEGGGQVVPTLSHILVAQNALLQKWSTALGDKDPEVIYRGDRVIMNYNIIVSLLARAQKKGLVFAGDQQLNNGLRGFYLREISKESQSDEAWKIGALSTSKSRGDYIEECQDNGVPIPDLVLNSQWTNHGELATELIIQGLVAELWSWESQTANDDGICLALPRWRTSDDTARALGVVCLGRSSSKVCFFDNPLDDTPNYTEFYADRAKAGNSGYGIERFIGGADLANHMGGECSDCHAGQNPFIVHPDDPAFMDLLSSSYIEPDDWPEPIVNQAWYQNPYPIPTIAMPSVGGCTGCHAIGKQAGLFPVLSKATPKYCDTVLAGVIGNTMPVDNAQSLYLASLCDQDPIRTRSEGIPVAPPADDLTFLSAPIVSAPLYACATDVVIRGARVGAIVDVFVNGNMEASGIVEDVYGQIFVVGSLAEGDKVTAIQRDNNASSSESYPTLVRDHSVDYPNGLPSPEIIKTVHECSKSIGVRNIPGATFRVSLNNGPFFVKGTGPKRNTSIPFNFAFSINDAFEVRQGFCGDWSPASNIGVAQPEPSPMPRVKIDPIIEGQNVFKFNKLAGGSSLQVDASSGSDTIASWAFYSKFWNHTAQLGSGFGPGDTIEVTQTLCTTSPVEVGPEIVACFDLPEPNIVPPTEGENYITIIDPVIGAWIQIYDDQGVEIGDGSAETILLSRPLWKNEAIIVVRSMGVDCRGQNGRLFNVKPGNGIPLGAQ